RRDHRARGQVRERARGGHALIAAVSARRDFGNPRQARARRTAAAHDSVRTGRSTLARMTAGGEDFDEPKTQPITTDQLDLHTFQPDEGADVVEEFLRAAQGEGYRIVRIIHGKGTGTLRRIVHSVLEKHPAVA